MIFFPLQKPIQMISSGPSRVGPGRTHSSFGPPKCGVLCIRCWPQFSAILARSLSLSFLSLSLKLLLSFEFRRLAFPALPSADRSRYLLRCGSRYQKSCSMIPIFHFLFISLRRRRILEKIFSKIAFFQNCNPCCSDRFILGKFWERGCFLFLKGVESFLGLKPRFLRVATIPNLGFWWEGKKFSV